MNFWTSFRLFIFCNRVWGSSSVLIVFIHYVAITLSSRCFEFLFAPCAIIWLLGIVLFIHPSIHCVAIALLQGLRFWTLPISFFLFLIFLVFFLSTFLFQILFLPSLSYHFHLIMNPLQIPMGFKYKMLFSVGPLSSTNVTSSIQTQIHNLVSPLSPSSSNSLVQLQSFDLDLQVAIPELV